MLHDAVVHHATSAPDVVLTVLGAVLLALGAWVFLGAPGLTRLLAWRERRR